MTGIAQAAEPMPVVAAVAELAFELPIVLPERREFTTAVTDAAVERL